MTLFSRAPVFVATSALVIGCSVYDSELISSASLSGGGSSLGGDAPPSDAGTAGKASSDGGTSTGKAGSSGDGTGGTKVPAEGGNGDAGEGPQPSGGTGGGGSGGAGSGGGGSAAGGASSGSGSGGTSGSGGKAGTGGGGASAGTAGKGGTAGTGGTGGTSGTAGSAGTAGSGGATVKCADHPIPLKTTWIPTAYKSSLGNGMETDGLYNPPAHLLDSSNVERWSSNEAQSARPELNQEWVQIDFGKDTTITGLTLNLDSDPGDYPRAYAVRLSGVSTPASAADVYPYNGDTAQPVRAMGAGAMGSLDITFPQPITGRYLSVRQTARNIVAPPWWTISELSVRCDGP